MTQPGGPEQTIGTGVINIQARIDQSQLTGSANNASAVFAKAFNSSLKKNIDFAGTFKGGDREAASAGDRAGDSFSSAFERAAQKNPVGKKLAASIQSDLDKLNFDTLQKRAAAKGIEIKVELDENGVPEKLQAISGDRTVELKVDVDKSLLSQANALFRNIGSDSNGAKQGVDNLNTGFRGLTETVSNVGNQLSEFGQSLSQGGRNLGGLGQVVTSVGSSIAGMANPIGLAVAAVGALALAGTAFVSVGIAMNTAALSTGGAFTAMAVAAGVLGGAIAVLPGVIFGALGALGAVLLVVKPLVEAFQAFEGTQNQTSKAVQSNTASILNNAIAIRSAKEAITDTVKRQSETFKQGAQNVEDAEKRVAAAVKNSAEAQKDLNEARKQAIRDAAELADSVSDLALDERQAKLDQAEAEAKYQAVLGDPKATAADQEQASINLERAQRRLIDATNAKLETEKKVADNAKNGIDASKSVVDAQERLTDSLTKEKEARAGVDKARADSAAANQAAADQVEKAEQRLIDIKKQQAAAAKDAAANATSGSAANDKYREALEKLSPAGREFLEIIKKFEPVLTAVSKVVQEAMLPALIPLTNTIKNLFGEFKNGEFVLGPVGKGLQTIGKVIGDLGGKLNGMLKGDTGKALGTLLDVGAQALKSIGGGILDAIKEIVPAMAEMGKASKPVLDAFGKGFGTVGKGLGQMFKEFSKPEVMQAFASALTMVFDIIGKTLPMVSTLITKLVTNIDFEKVGGAIVSMMTSVFEIFNKMAESGVIDAFSDVLVIVAAEFAKMVDSGLVEQLATGFVDLMKQIGPLLPVMTELAITVLPLVIDTVLWMAEKFNQNFGLIVIWANDLSKSIQTAWTSIKTAVGFAYDWLKQNVFTPLGNFFTVTIPAAAGTVRDRVSGAWDTIKTSVTTAWNWLRDNVMSPIGTFFTTTIPNAATTVKTAVTTAWTNIKDSVSGIWGWARDNVFTPIKTFFDTTLPGAASSMWTKVSGYWTSLKTFLVGFWDDGKGGGIKNTVFDPIVNFLTGGKDKDGALTGAFKTAVNSIRTIWDKLKDIAKTPVKFLIETVYNEGIVRVWNNIADKVPGIDPISPMSLPEGFAKGGLLPGNSGMNFKDDRLASVGGKSQVALAGGEFVMNARSTRKFLPQLEAMNEEGLPGGKKSVFDSAFALGGLIPDDLWKNAKKAGRGLLASAFNPVLDGLLSKIPVPNPANWSNTPKAIYRSPIEGIKKWLAEDDSKNPVSDGGSGSGGGGPVEGGSFEKALAFARDQHGKPYIWANNGPRGYDCSGFMSAILNVIEGKSNPYFRRFSTIDGGGSTVAGGSLKKNKRSAFMVGMYNHGGKGHTAGTLNGVNVESTGDHVRVGHDADGWNASRFDHHYGFAKGGRVFDPGEGGSPALADAMSKISPQFLASGGMIPHAKFDNGGALPPKSTTLVTNATSDRELLLTETQIKELFGKGGDSGVVINGDVHIHADDLETALKMLKNAEQYTRARAV